MLKVYELEYSHGHSYVVFNESRVCFFCLKILS